jgi:hypothetical protein
MRSRGECIASQRMELTQQRAVADLRAKGNWGPDRGCG